MFVESWIEDQARRAYHAPEDGKKYVVEHDAPRALDWEVAGLVYTPPDRVAPPVVFVNAGEHHVEGLHSSAEFHWPQNSSTVRPYRLAPYDELYRVPIASSNKTASIFNSNNDQQVLGADRMEKYIFMWIGTDDAGHPRRNDEILLHFDQSHWMDPQNYSRYLRLPPGVL